MAVTKTVLKKVRQQAVVKFIGDGVANINYLDLMLANDTIDLPNIQMNITGMAWSTDGNLPIVITRNSVVVQYLQGTDNWALTQAYGISDTSQNAANIFVTMPANSMIYLTISKPAGFIEPNQQNNYTNE
jgi:hypothetical protein